MSVREPEARRFGGPSTESVVSEHAQSPPVGQGINNGQDSFAVRPNRTGIDRRLEVALLCDDRRDIAATVRQNIDALCNLSAHNVRKISMLGDIPHRLDLDRFDVLAIHYSLTPWNEGHIGPVARQKIRRFPGLNVQFLQDEYREVNLCIDCLSALGTNVLFTCVPEGEASKVYPAERLPNLRLQSILTGCVPDALIDYAVPCYGDRPIDVGYRARKVPPWLGTLGQEKSLIGVRFIEDAPRYGLQCDVSDREEDRLYGENWIRFLTRCKAVLGTESGASVFDFTGEIERACRVHLSSSPKASFDQLRAAYFAREEGQIHLNQISPRCFEAAALRTLMILYEGEYSGILQPWRHYVPIAKDHSNMKEVVSVLRDEARAQSIVERAYQEIARNPRYSWRHFVNRFDKVVKESQNEVGWLTSRPYSEQEFRRANRPTVKTRMRRTMRRTKEAAYRFVFAKILRSISEKDRDDLKKLLKRVLQ